MDKGSFCKIHNQLDNIPAGRPVVFISYSWDNEEHKGWVKRLSDDLRQRYGIYSILDQYNSGGINLPDFMEKGIESSDRVLIIGTPRYKQKLDKKNSGCGVQYEEMIISSELLANTKTTKFIPILREGTPSDSFKKYFASRLWYDFRCDDQYKSKIKDLAKDIWGEIRPTELGPKPVLYNSNDIRYIIKGYESACLANSPAPNCFWSVFHKNDSMTPVTSEVELTNGEFYYERQFPSKLEYRIKLFYEGQPFAECTEGSAGVCMVILYGAKCGPLMLTISHENGIEETNIPHSILSDLGFSVIEEEKYVGCEYLLWKKDTFYALLEGLFGSGGYRYSFYISNNLDYLLDYKREIINQSAAVKR